MTLIESNVIQTILIGMIIELGTELAKTVNSTKQKVGVILKEIKVLIGCKIISIIRFDVLKDEISLRFLN